MTPHTIYVDDKPSHVILAQKPMDRGQMLRAIRLYAVRTGISAFRLEMRRPDEWDKR